MAELNDLIKALENPDEKAATSAAESLGSLGDKRAVEPLIALLSSPSWKLRQAAAKNLGLLSDQKAVDPLVAALADQYPAVEGSAARSLGKLGDQRAVEPLGALAKSEFAFVRQAAVEALSLLVDDQDRLSQLIKLPDRKPEEGNINQGVLCACCEERPSAPRGMKVHLHKTRGTGGGIAVTSKTVIVPCCSTCLAYFKELDKRGMRILIPVLLVGLAGLILTIQVNPIVAFTIFVGSVIIGIIGHARAGSFVAVPEEMLYDRIVDVPAIKAEFRDGWGLGHGTMTSGGGANSIEYE